MSSIAVAILGPLHGFLKSRAFSNILTAGGAFVLAIRSISHFQ